MPIPYASSGIPITTGMQVPPNDNMGTTTEGRARAEAFRRLMNKAPGTDYQSAMQQLPGQMQEEAGARAAAGPTVLQPSRTQAFSTRDAQSLAALDPRALQEANALAALDKPKTMTGTVGGQSFEMTPSARVDRNALARLYAQAQERKMQERQDAVRGQEQSGKERLVSIPGEQATKRREMELGTEERITGKKLEADAPMREADIAAKRAAVAATTGAEARAQAEAGRQPNQEKIAILEKMLEAKRASPFATTIQGRKDIAAAERMLASMAGVDIPQTGADQNLDAAASIAGADAVMNDPGVEALMKKIEETQQGTLLNSPENRNAQNLHIETLNKRLRALAQAQGVDINEIAPQIKARLSKAINKRSLGQSLGSNPVTSFIDSLLGVQPTPPPAALVGN